MIVQSFLHTGARQIDSLKSYERFCVYQEISGKNWNEWLRLSIYSAYHYEIVSWLFADSPRQLLNATTIAYIVSNKFTSGDIGGVISRLAQNDKKQAVLLSFMFFSLITWIFFTIKNLIVLVSSVCIIPSTKKNSGKKYSTYCADLVAKNVSELYNEKAEIYEEELAKRRKIPSFMQNTDFDSFNYEIERNIDNADTKDFDKISLSDSSFEKKSPYNIDLKEIPLSHSKVNLAHTSTTEFYKQNSYINSYDDPFSQSTTNLNLSIDDFQHNDSRLPTNTRDSYVYMPAKVYEAHQYEYANPFITENKIDNIDKHKDNLSYKNIQYMITELEMEEIQPAISPIVNEEFETTPRQKEKPSGLYRSTEIGNQPRTLL
ncbi:hypothetical protein CANINC_002207 [Pichia inconspicua]|uniref:Uncharacterized protein n=1 Tax=Pichia inconspicua TaxID=52247 RepID=A0A4T0X1N8_9ASCO|nr:hypothetical protein CANINC_002207 [[Candida] inconspicua]